MDSTAELGQILGDKYEYMTMPHSIKKREVIATSSFHYSIYHTTLKDIADVC